MRGKEWHIFTTDVGQNPSHDHFLKASNLLLPHCTDVQHGSTAWASSRVALCIIIKRNIAKYWGGEEGVIGSRTSCGKCGKYAPFMTAKNGGLAQLL
jgi:hypothetical protein